MSIIKAEQIHLNTVTEITHSTIKTIYPHYYPKGAVEFFLEHHSKLNISNDIDMNKVYLCSDDNNFVGTVTVNANEILRLFVLPEFQGRGFGREMLDFAEKLILSRFSEIKLAASLPAKMIYLKRNYKEKESKIIKTRYGDFLCYDVMIKQI